jgi:hypothetical protein
MNNMQAINWISDCTCHIKIESFYWNQVNQPSKNNLEINSHLHEGNFSHPLVCFFTPCAVLYAPEKKVLLTRAELLFNLNPPNFFFSVKFTLKKSLVYVYQTFSR